MRHTQLIMLVTVVALPLLGCGNASSEKPKVLTHARVDAPEVKVAMMGPQAGKATLAGTQDAASAEIRRITLSETATKRLAIEFAEVKGTAERLEAPYNALLYDASGREWVFVSPAPNVFTRVEIKVDTIEGGKVLYTNGPAAGTKIVTMGAAELYGIEFGVGK